MFFYYDAELSAEERYWFLHNRRWYVVYCFIAPVRLALFVGNCITPPVARAVKVLISFLPTI